MRAVRLVLASVSLLAVALTPTSSMSQEQIPKELALALIRFGGSEGGEIIVGKLPPDLASALTLPPGGRILGSFIGVGYGQAIIALPVGTDSAMAFVRRALVERGWLAREPMMGREGGLQYRQRGSVPTTFCKAGTPDGLTIAAQFYGRESLVRLTRNTGSSLCDPDRSAGALMAERVEFSSMSVGRPYMPFEALPPLWSPGDPMTSSRLCRAASSGGSQSQRQVLRTELSPEEILQDYGKQLDSAGWKPLDSTGESMTRTWAKTGGSRDTMPQVTLTVTKMSAPGCYDIELRATVRRPSR